MEPSAQPLYIIWSAAHSAMSSVPNFSHFSIICEKIQAFDISPTIYISPTLAADACETCKAVRFKSIKWLINIHGRSVGRSNHRSISWDIDSLLVRRSVGRSDCRSVGGFVGRLVGWFSWLVGPSVRRSVSSVWSVADRTTRILTERTENGPTGQE